MNQRNYSDLEHLELVARRIAESGIDITSDYQDWISITFACTSLGEPARDAYHTICRQYPNYRREECDEKFDNCLRTGRGDVSIATLFQLAKDHGIDTSLPRGRRPKTETQREEERKNLFESIRDWLNAHYEFRYNLIKEQVEARRMDETEWQEMDDRQFKSLVTEMHADNVKITQTNLDAYISSEMLAPPCNPVLEYAQSLSPWKPTHKDYIADLFGHLGLANDENLEFLLRMAMKWYVKMVAVAIGAETSNQLMVILSGELEGSGKSNFVERFLPEPLRKYIHRVFALSQQKDKDELLAVARSIVCFLDEIQLNPSTLNKLKNYVGGAASTAVTERTHFGHFSAVRRVHTCWIGSTNFEVFLPDSTGDRRFVILPVDHRGRDYKTLPQERAFAQGYYLATHPKAFQHEITPEEIAKLKEINQKYVAQDLCTSLIPTVLRHPAAGEQAQAVSTGEIIAWLTSRTGPNREFTPTKVGIAMKKNGFEAKRTGRGMRFFVVRLMMEHLEQESKQIANEAIAPELPF